ncbi:hypothetical protein BZA70DRAFT_281373 [Myxozyma melibiosi]|uniref:Zn(2)-C6 fungal-type domain-containing protein n=1 Tax=Myxozyma melibiosi TaxID=54550 RepID=A0ABR1F2J1_9ASCO
MAPPPPSTSPGPNTVTTSSGVTLNMTAAMARSSGISLRTGRPKRKKASRACFHCQKAHLTCDDARPCQRCVKRGLSDTCHDGVRKKAKYLSDAPDKPPAKTTDASTTPAPTSTTTSRAARALASSNTSNTSSNSNSKASVLPMNGTIDPSSLGSDPLAEDSPDATDSIFSNLNLSAYDFGSKTANMEFSYDPPLSASNILGAAPNSSSSISYDYGFADMAVRDSNWAARGLASLLSGNSPQNSASPPTPTASEPSPLLSSSSGTAAHRSSLGNEVMGPPTGTATTSSSSSSALPPHIAPRRRRDPETVYASVTQPFSYTPGYHGIIAYLKSRFDRPHLMRVARAMAAFRPSFIACTKTLKEEDLIFMEKCFQRTLLEYEKFISYSGTPTIVWRRTGQVAAVGKEFCILTGWTKEQLLGKRTFMVEFMDDHSVVEYFEGFSKLAFGDSRGATMMECTLLSPTGRKIPTACTWTIKRDVFDIPMMIVGNFLPILN